MKNHYSEKLLNAVIKNFKAKQESNEIAEKPRIVPSIDGASVPWTYLRKTIQKHKSKLFQNAYPQVSFLVNVVV